MSMDELFDGSDAHLLPGNADLIEVIKTLADSIAKEAADALEAADKRICHQHIRISKGLALYVQHRLSLRYELYRS